MREWLVCGSARLNWAVPHVWQQHKVLLSRVGPQPGVYVRFCDMQCMSVHYQAWGRSGAMSRYVYIKHGATGPLLQGVCRVLSILSWQDAVTVS